MKDTELGPVNLLGLGMTQFTLFSLLGCLLAFNSSLAQSFGSCDPGTAPLSAARKFAVLGGSAVTNTGPTTLIGDIGVGPGSAITGMSGITLAGTVHQADAVAAQAQSEAAAEYNSLAALPFDVDLSGQDLGGMVLTPGIYRFSSSAQLTGQLTLDGAGHPNAVYIFQIGSTLTTAGQSSVKVINGTSNYVFWLVGSSATLGSTTAFAGSIMARASITMNTGASIQCGNALALIGAVSLQANLVGVCSGNGWSCDTICTTINVRQSRLAKTTSRNVIAKARTLNDRVRRFERGAASCGNHSYKKGELYARKLLQEITALVQKNSLQSTVNRCLNTACVMTRSTLTVRRLRKLARKLYQVQLATKLGAIASCPVRKDAVHDPKAHRSIYYLDQLTSSIKVLSGKPIECN